MDFDWDPHKNHADKRKHGVSFEEAVEVFRTGTNPLEIFDEGHSELEDRFITIGPIRRGLVLVVWTVRTAQPKPANFGPLGNIWRASNIRPNYGESTMVTIPELTDADFARALLRSRRQRMMEGEFQTGADIADLRAFVGLTQSKFAKALGVSVRTLQGWEQSRRKPQGPGLALLRIAARHPNIIRENLQTAA